MRNKRKLVIFCMLMMLIMIISFAACTEGEQPVVDVPVETTQTPEVIPTQVLELTNTLAPTATSVPTATLAPTSLLTPTPMPTNKYEAVWEGTIDEVAYERPETSIMFDVPGYDVEHVNAGSSERYASEMNLYFKTVYPFDKMNTGVVYYYFSTDSVLPDGKYAFNVLIDEVGLSAEMEAYADIWVENGDMICGGYSSSDDIFTSGIYNFDGVTYFYFSMSYDYPEGHEVTEKVIKIRLRTHNDTTETVKSVVWDRMCINDSINGMYDIDFDKAIYGCERYDYAFDTYEPWSFTLLKNDQPIEYENKTLFEYVKEDTSSAVLINEENILFNWLGYDENQFLFLNDKFLASQMNLEISINDYAEELVKGHFEITICVHDGEMPDGLYSCSSFIIEKDGQYFGDSEEYLSVQDGIITAFFSKPKRIGGKTYITLSGSYDLRDYNKESGRDLLVTLQTHCEQVYQEEIPVYITGIVINDFVNGVIPVDFRKSKITVSKYRKSDGKRDPSHVEFASVKYEICEPNAPKSIIVGGEFALSPISEVNEEIIECTYSSSNESVAIVDENGVISALSVGKTRITLTDKLHKGSYSFELEVIEPYFSLITERTKIPVAGQYYFGVKANGFKAESKKWSSSNEKVGTIDEKTGLFTGKKPGATTITVEDSSGIKFSFDVQVVEDNVDISKLIKITANSDAPAGLDKTIYNHLVTIYKPMMAMFGGEDRTPIVDVIFKSLEGTGAAAYVSWNGGMEYGEQNIFSMVIGIETMVSNIEDIDCSTHEFMHVAQGYVNNSDAYGNNATWLTEGLADYARYLFAQNDDKSGWTMTEYYRGSNYDTGYGVTGSFIKFVADNYEPSIAECLNEIMKKHAYTDQIWMDVTGYSVDELWEKFATWSWLNEL